jgi:hypothetical protein
MPLKYTSSKSMTGGDERVTGLNSAETEEISADSLAWVRKSSLFYRLTGFLSLWGDAHGPGARVWQTLRKDIAFIWLSWA